MPVLKWPMCRNSCFFMDCCFLGAGFGSIPLSCVGGAVLQAKWDQTDASPSVAKSLPSMGILSGLITERRTRHLFAQGARCDVRASGKHSNSARRAGAFERIPWRRSAFRSNCNRTACARARRHFLWSRGSHAEKVCSNTGCEFRKRRCSQGSAVCVGSNTSLRKSIDA